MANISDHISFKRLKVGQNVPRPPFRDGALVYDSDGVLKFIDGDTGKKTAIVDSEGAQVIEANSNQAALRITQAGSGDALVVEDSAHPDATPVVVDSIGQVILGVKEAFSGASLQISADANIAPNGSIVLRRCSDSSNASVAIQRTRGSADNISPTQNGDTLGAFIFTGYFNSTDTRIAARILSEVDGNITTTQPGGVPGNLRFATRAQGNTGNNPAERMRITSGGNIGIGTTSPSSKLHVSGDLTVSSATTATTATAGSNGDVPAQVEGYLVVSINGTSCKIPYYAT